MPFKPALEFDRIYTIETLSHAPDAPKVVRNLYSMLKPGGKLVCIEYEFDYSSLGVNEWKAIDFAMQYGALHGAKQFGPGDFISYLKSAGFKDITEHDWTQACLPSFKRIRRIGRPFKKVAGALKLEKYFVNTTISDYYANAVEENKFWFKAYTATKPKR